MIHNPKLTIVLKSFKASEKALEESANDLDSAIKRLNELRLGCGGNNLEDATSHSDVPYQANDHQDKKVPLANKRYLLKKTTGLFYRRVPSGSTNLDDAREGAARALEALEKSICSRVGAEAANSFQQENVMLKKQVQLVLQENMILKRAVSIQHERRKEFDDKAQELQHLKQLISKYQEQVRTLEVNNYALAMHLKQAQQDNSFPGSFNPDVF